MKRLFLALLLLAQPASVFAAQAPETPLVTGPSMAQVPASQILIAPTGASTAVSLGELAADQGVLLDTFYRSGDVDYTAAITRAIASGKTILLGPKSYTASSNIVINANFTLIGTPGISKIVAASAIPTGTNSTWIRISAATVMIDGVIFDEAGFGSTNNTWMVKTEATTTNLIVRRSAFKNAAGSLGYCFMLNGDATPADNPSYTFESDEFSGCSKSGLRVEQALNVKIVSPSAHDNLNSGLEVNYILGTDTNLNQRISIIGGQAYNNTLSGVIVGNFVEVNSPRVWGNGLPSVAYMLISGMTNYGNGAYGIQVANNYITIIGNTLTGNAVGQPNDSSAGGGGILFSAQYSSVIGNNVANNGYYAIDAGGSLEGLIEGNVLTNCGLGVNTGSSIGTVVRGNKFRAFTDKAVNIPNTDQGGSPATAFPQVTRDIFIENNDIEMSSMSLSSYAVYAVDGVQNVNVKNNRFRYSQTAYDAGMRPGIAMIAITDSVNVMGNSVTAPIRAGATTQLTNAEIFDVNPTGGSNWLIIPDVLTDIRVSSAAFVVGNLSPNTSFNHAGGEISWVNMTAAGSGYNAATTTVAFSGSGGGSGATGAVYVWNGTVIGVAMLTRGSAYSGTITVTITDSSLAGSGATATAQVNVPIPRNRKVKIHTKTAGTINVTGSFTTQTNPTAANLAITAGTVVEILETGSFVSSGTGGSWNVENYYH